MDVSEKWGTDVDTAVNLALAELKLTIDEVDVTVLEEPSRGFFGIGSKLALVRVEKKKPVEKVKAEEVKRKGQDKTGTCEGTEKGKDRQTREKPEPEPKKICCTRCCPCSRNCRSVCSQRPFGPCIPKGSNGTDGTGYRYFG